MMNKIDTTFFEKTFITLSFLTFLTASWDVIAVFEWHGTWRIAYFFMLPIVLMAPFVWFKQKTNLYWDLLIAIACLNLLFTALNSPHLRGWIYAGWFFFFVGYALVFSYFASNLKIIILLVQALFLAAFINLSFGMVQFIGGLFGAELWATQQWPQFGGINRISGFTFEPSYFATYTLFYWVSSLILIEHIKRLEAFPKQLVRATFAISSLCMIFTTSRMGWLFMAFIMTIYSVRALICLTHKKPLSPFLKAINAANIGFGALVLILGALNFDKVRMLFWDVGLFGGRMTNVSTRFQGTEKAWHVFLDNWIIGVGYGEVPYEMMLIKLGKIIESRVSEFEIGAPFVELAAATGIIGAVLFLAFSMELILTNIKNFVSDKTDTLKIIAFALTVGMIAQTLILQLNQNLFRIYYWNNIAILLAFIMINMSVRKTK